MSILNMSGVNISYEIDSGGGENNFFDKTSLKSKEKSSYASIIAGEIVHEILENALDIATKASDTGIHWREIKESQSHLKVTKNSFIEMDDSRTEGKNENEELSSNNVCCDVIGDIIENTGLTTLPEISNIIDSLNSINANQDAQNDKNSMVPLEIEMKRLLNEILTPPYEIIDYECVPLKGGVGDQPFIENSQKVTDECTLRNEPTRPSVEKKSRVTDLVKNSPKIITEYLKMDESSKKNKEEWEENEELLVNVIELDCTEPGDIAYKVPAKYCPELIPLPQDSDDDQLLNITNDDKRGIINTRSSTIQNDDQKLQFYEESSNLAKGDEKKLNSKDPISQNDAVIENEVAPNEKLNLTSNTLQDEKTKKKKIGLVNRIWRFFKRSHKQQVVQGSSTST